MTARDRLANARLYLVCDARPGAFLDAALRGGADLIQLRDKTLGDDGLVAAAGEFRDTGALFILNDRPDLVDACGADGVHVGQDDADPASARAAVGAERIVGRGAEGGRRGDQPFVVEGLVAQLHDVDAAAQRGVQEGRRAGVADEVEAGLRQAFPRGHPVSVASLR